MAIINQGIDNNSPQAIDRRFGKLSYGKTVPYTSIAEANAAISTYFRHIGKSVLIDPGTGPVEYWWRDGIADVDLVIKYTAPASEWKPYKIILAEDGSFSIPENSLLDMIVVVPTVGFDLKIGTAPAGYGLLWCRRSANWPIGAAKHGHLVIWVCCSTTQSPTQRLD